MKNLKKRLAMMMVIIMTVAQTPTVYAAETSLEPGILEDELTQDFVDAPVEIENAELDDETGGSILPEGENAESDGGRDVPEDETLSVNMLSEENATPNEPAGDIKGMPEGYTVSDKEMADKKALQAHNVMDSLNRMTAGTDYVEDEVIFTCFDEDYARTVADAYNGTLKECRYGVATIKLDTGRLSVANAVKAGMDVTCALPPVNPNYLTKLEDPKTIGISHKNEDTMISGIFKKKVADPMGWSHWGRTLNDPALDPGFTFYDRSNEDTLPGYQWMHDMVGSYEAWEVTMGDSDVTVAVIDTGVCANHEDLKGQVKNTVLIADDLVDSEGHGTHVAGIIAMKANNGVGGVGIAPNVKILSVPIFTGSSYNDAYLARAINYVADGTGGQGRQAEVINMSVGGYGYNNVVQDACDLANRKGVTICASMGNDSTNANKYPAAYNHVISVAAVDESGQKTDFSTYGPWADIAAPGYEVFSTWNGHTKTNTTTDYTRYYASWPGTSMATPVVAGACALYISAMGKDKVTPEQVEKALKKSATKVKGSEQIGVGIVNVAKMLPDDDIAPEIYALTEEGEKANLSSLSANDLVCIKTSADSYGGSWNYLGFAFTVNGKNPVIKDGMIREGYAYNGPISGADLVNYYGVKPNEPVTLKAVRITGKGTLSKMAMQTIIVNGAAVTSATQVYVSGPESVARGKSVSYTAECYPLYLNTKVTWSLENNTDGVTINPKTGKVKVKKTVAGSFTVVATAQDEGQIKGTLSVNVVDPATSVSLQVVEADKEINQPVYDKKTKNIKSVRLYNVDINGTDIQEDRLVLSGRTSNNTMISYSSSKPSVAYLTRDQSGNVVVIGDRAGTAKITCKAMDGSNKKAVLTVKVIVPASKLEVFRNKTGQNCIAYGKSGTLRAAVGSTYGKPTIKKVKWDILEIVGYIGTNGTRVTDQYSKYIKVKNGKVSVSSKMKKAGGYNYYRVYVKATTTDGTGWSDNMGFLVLSPAKKASAVYKKYRGNTGGAQIVYFSTDYGLDYALTSGGQLPNSPTVKSSNPKVCSFVRGPADIQYDSKSNQIIYYYYVYNYKPGKATLTFMVNDGTNKKAKCTIRVR